MTEVKAKGKVKSLDNNISKNTLLISTKSHLSIETFISVLTFVILGLAWYLVTKFELVSEVFIPSPAKVLNCFIDTLFNGYKGYPLMKHLGDSMY